MDILIKIRKSLQSRDSRTINTLREIRMRPGFRVVEGFFARLMFGSNLKSLAVYFGTDKWGGHWYAQHYEKQFLALRKRHLNILEIGIGGYDAPKGGGCSLRMWRTFFYNSFIYGIDIYDKHFHDERRIKTYKGSQVDEVFLERVCGDIGDMDIIIDDGSHINEHVLQTFAFLFPKLKLGGVYVIEDIQTSYWPDLGGSSNDLNNHKTGMNLVKELLDGLNYSEFIKDSFEPSYCDRHVVSVHCYHNLVFIWKGLNNEGSLSKYTREQSWSQIWS